MQIERIIIRTRNKDNISQLIDKITSEETVEILGVEYKVTSVGVGVEANNKVDDWATRIFELEGVIE